MKKNNEKGFSLIELLVVVIIIAIVAAIAIPNLLASRRAANEASAISSLRTIHSANATYQATLGANTLYAADLPALATAGLIDTALGGASGSKSGYNFLATASTTTANYCAQAEPQSTSTGTRSFAVNEQGVIYQYGAAGAANTACGAAGAFTVGAGTAIQ